MRSFRAMAWVVSAWHLPEDHLDVGDMGVSWWPEIELDLHVYNMYICINDVHVHYQINME